MNILCTFGVSGYLAMVHHVNLRGLFDTKPILLEEQHRYYLTHSFEWDKGVHAFIKGIRQKVNA